jgi:hypothetical protein
VSAYDYLGCDTPSYCNTSTLGRYWDSVHADTTVTSGTGYSGGNGWSASTANGSLTRYHDTLDLSSFALGFRIKVTSAPGATKQLVAILAPDGTVQCSAALTTSAEIALYRGDPSTGTLLDTSAAIPTGTFLDFGFEGQIHSAAGYLSASIGVSGNSSSFDSIAESGTTNTQEHASDTTWLGYTIGTTSGLVINHLYWRKLTLKPGCLVSTLRPDAVGSYNGWTANTGTLATALDDTTPDDDTTIANSTGAFGNDAFSVSMDTLAATPVIHGVDVVVTVRNGAGAPALQFRPVVLSDGVSFVGHLHDVTDGAWLGARDAFPVNPRTGESWTRAEVNEAEFGGETV